MFALCCVFVLCVGFAEGGVDPLATELCKDLFKSLADNLQKQKHIRSKSPKEVLLQ